MPDLMNDGARVHYEVVGKGEPVVLLHGFAASGEFWMRAGYVESLSSECQLVVVDFRGHGRSEHSRDENVYGLQFDVADALATLDATGIDAATVCGWSWGGTTGLALAATHPTRVRAVLAIGASGRHGRFPDLPADLSWGSEYAARLEREGVDWLAGEIERQGAEPWLRELVAANDPLALAAWCRAQVTAPEIDRPLRSVRQPVLYMPGELELDILNFPSPLLPHHARMEIIEGATHVGAFLDASRVLKSLRDLMTVDRLPSSEPSGGA